MLEKVISGGQTGADQAGLRAGQDSGFATGGWLTKGCRTLTGPRPDFLTLYGMQEHKSPDYARRTEYNVKDSDGTVRFARNFKSRGELCTLRAIKWFRREYFDVHMDKPPAHEEFVRWLVEKEIRTLNVAGNAEETAEGVGDFTYEYLMQAFALLKKSK